PAVCGDKPIVSDDEAVAAPQDLLPGREVDRAGTRGVRAECVAVDQVGVGHGDRAGKGQTDRFAFVVVEGVHRGLEPTLFLDRVDAYSGVRLRVRSVNKLLVVRRVRRRRYGTEDPNGHRGDSYNGPHNSAHVSFLLTIRTYTVDRPCDLRASGRSECCAE